MDRVDPVGANPKRNRNARDAALIVVVERRGRPTDRRKRAVSH
jgi:hypothetical protein